LQQSSPVEWNEEAVDGPNLRRRQLHRPQDRRPAGGL